MQSTGLAMAQACRAPLDASLDGYFAEPSAPPWPLLHTHGSASPQTHSLGGWLPQFADKAVTASTRAKLSCNHHGMMGMQRAGGPPAARARPPTSDGGYTSGFQHVCLTLARVGFIGACIYSCLAAQLHRTFVPAAAERALLRPSRRAVPPWLGRGPRNP